MKTCITCGMPLEGNHVNDVGFESPEGPVCQYDAENGTVKPPDRIFEGGVQFFMQSVTRGDRELAERLTRKNMKSLPYWQTRPFAALEGPEATEQEFQEAMSTL